MLSSAKDTADIVVEVLTTPVEKLKALLGAPDKKAHILEMAGNDEIDAPFIALLEQNIEAAKAARADDAAEFMGWALKNYLEFTYQSIPSSAQMIDYTASIG